MDSTTRTVLITGASGGIGFELAKLFAKDRYNLVLTARSGDKLKQIAVRLQEEFGVTVKTVALDLAAEQAAKILFDHLAGEGMVVDVLVNNAGFGVYGGFAGLAEEEILGQIQLNVTALTHLTRLFLPGMIARRGGKIMNVASTAAFQAGPLMAVYYAPRPMCFRFPKRWRMKLRGQEWW